MELGYIAWNWAPSASAEEREVDSEREGCKEWRISLARFYL